MFDEEHLSELIPGLILFQAGDYWECHEVLEDAWMEAAHDPVRYIYWAVIQVAVSLYHYEDGNFAGAFGMMKNAKEKLRECEKRHVESELLEQKLAWSKFKQFVGTMELKEGPKTNSLFMALKKFKFPVLGEKNDI